MKRNGTVVAVAREFPGERGSRCVVTVRLSALNGLGETERVGEVTMRLHESDARRYPIGREVDVSIVPGKEPA